MSKLIKGNVSVTVFKPDKIPVSIDETRRCLEKFSFKKLESTDVRDESTGWVDGVLSFDSENFSSLMHDGFFVFALRNDKYSFSSSQIRPYLEEAEYRYKTDNNLEYIAAQQKKDIKESVIKKLKVNSFPKTTISEVAWDMETGIVFLFSQSSQIIIKFTDVFEKTFETNLSTVSFFDSVANNGQIEKIEPVLGKIWSLK